MPLVWSAGKKAVRKDLLLKFQLSLMTWMMTKKLQHCTAQQSDMTQSWTSRMALAGIFAKKASKEETHILSFSIQSLNHISKAISLYA